MNPHSAEAVYALKFELTPLKESFPASSSYPHEQLMLKRQIYSAMAISSRNHYRSQERLCLIEGQLALLAADAIDLTGAFMNSTL